ncbi:hypothetical protein PSEUDO8AS_60004 [Pseudomonas sp. 8AS]|nr:hypothetical protein PSEUDO8AS_60004 [Pseudomonas sp. 8AS]
MDLKDVGKRMKCFQTNSKPTQLIRVVDFEAKPGDRERPHVVKSKYRPVVPEHEARPGRINRKLCGRCAKIVGILDELGEPL